MKALIVIVSMLLAGCVSWDAAQMSVADKGAAVADEVRDTAEFALCKGITVGAWVRAYGNSPQRAEAWRQICSVQVQQIPAR